MQACGGISTAGKKFKNCMGHSDNTLVKNGHIW